MVLLYQRGSLYVLYRFPCVVAFGVPQPLYEILQLSFPPLTLVALDGLDLVLFIVIDEVRWWMGEVFSMFYCFNIWG